MKQNNFIPSYIRTLICTFKVLCFLFVAAIQNGRAYLATWQTCAFDAFLAPNSLPLRREDLNGPSSIPIPALVAKFLTVWVRTSERGHTSVL